MSNLTLVVLAAGMGSRYGGIKQMEGLGPSREVLLDYSVYDAIRAGFGKAVIVIRKEMEPGFRQRITRRFEDRIAVEFAFQSMQCAPVSRDKPLGTGHALLSAAHQVDGPMGVINADDFYGPSSFQLLAQSLKKMTALSGVNIGFQLEKTLSSNGTVSRAVCEASEENFLTRIEEHTGISKKEGSILGYFEGALRNLPPKAIVSLNLWGFAPDFLPFLQENFEAFLLSMKDPHKDEFYLPTAVFRWIEERGAAVKLKPSGETWLGLTHPEDKSEAAAKLGDLIARGIYPPDLWDKAR